MKKVMAVLALAVVLIGATFAVVTASRKSAASATRPGGIVITSRVTFTDQNGQSAEGTETVYADPATGEFRTVKHYQPGKHPFEFGFSRQLGFVKVAGDAAARHLEVNSRISKTAGTHIYSEAQLRAAPDLLRTEDVLGQTGYVLRTYADPETKTKISTDATYLPGLPPLPVRMRWYNEGGVVHELVEPLSIERRPLLEDELMGRYAGLPRVNK